MGFRIGYTYSTSGVSLRDDRASPPPFLSTRVNGGGKVGHLGGLIVDSPSPSGTFCRRP